MQVARTTSSAQAVAKASVDAPTRATTSYAPLYLTTSLGNTSFDLEDLEKIALDRLRVLKAAERARTEAFGNNAGNTGGAGGRTEAIRASIRKAEKQYGLNVPSGTGSAKARMERESRIMKDEASHFLVRLALCRTHEQRQWVSSAECALFNTRLEFTGVEFGLHALSKVNDSPEVEAVSLTEMEKFRKELDAVARGPCRSKTGVDFTSVRYYKTKFEQVPSLIRSRRVFVRHGNVYVPERNVMDIVGQQFRSRLNGGLITASKAGIVADSDARMRLILESIRQHFTAETAERAFDANSKRDKVDTISLNELNDSVDCMPLCMRHMMHKLRENHHLRYSARLQLGVFLKGCGLSMDDSLRFWKAEFGKGDISADKFEKNYAYNIRHHYGKEGKRKNLQPFACIKVINDRPGPGEHNGCPYREMQSLQLTQTLRAVGVEPNSIGSIVKTAGAGNFQLACGLCFSSSQPGPHEMSETGLPGYVPNHPNEYFIEARRRRFGLVLEQQPAIDDDLDDDELISAAVAAEVRTESQTQDDDDGNDKDKDEGQDEANKKDSEEPSESADDGAGSSSAQPQPGSVDSAAMQDGQTDKENGAGEGNSSTAQDKDVAMKGAPTTVHEGVKDVDMSKTEESDAGKCGATSGAEPAADKGTAQVADGERPSKLAKVAEAE